MARKNSKKAGASSKGKAKAVTKSSSKQSSSSFPSAAIVPPVLIAFVAIVLAAARSRSSGGGILETSTNAAGDATASSNPNHTTSSGAGKSTSNPLVRGPEISLAAFHDVNSQDEEALKKDLMTYIAYDDGYASCLMTDSGGESDMFGVRQIKRMKYEFLQKIATRPEFWTTHLSPQSTNEELVESTEHLTTLCRFLTLTHEDYGGRAKSVLQKAMEMGDIFGSVEKFSVKSQGPASDYRTTVCLHRLTDQAFNSNAVTKEEKLSKSLLTKVRYQWAKDTNDLKKKALAEPPRPMPEGWTIHREEDNGHVFYVNKSTGKSSWIRPVPVFGGKGVIVEMPAPAKNGKEAFAPVIARKKPCPIEQTEAVLAGESSSSSTNDDMSSSFKVTSSGGPAQPMVTVKASGSDGAKFTVKAN